MPLLAVLFIVPYLVLAVLDANVATAVIAGLALLGAVWTRRQADATARRTLTASYNERWRRLAEEAIERGEDVLYVKQTG